MVAYRVLQGNDQTSIPRRNLERYHAVAEIKMRRTRIMTVKARRVRLHLQNLPASERGAEDDVPDRSADIAFRVTEERFRAASERHPDLAAVLDATISDDLADLPAAAEAEIAARRTVSGRRGGRPGARTVSRGASSSRAPRRPRRSSCGCVRPRTSSLAMSWAPSSRTGTMALPGSSGTGRAGSARPRSCANGFRYRRRPIRGARRDGHQGHRQRQANPRKVGLDVHPIRRGDFRRKQRWPSSRRPWQRGRSEYLEGHARGGGRPWLLYSHRRRPGGAQRRDALTPLKPWRRIGASPTR